MGQLWGAVGLCSPPPPRWRRHFRRGSARNGGVAAGGHVGSRYDLINGRVNERPAEFPKKRKRSRWNQDSLEQKTVIPGMPTVIPPGLTREQERAYIGNAARRHLGLAGHVGGHVGGGGAEFGSGGGGVDFGVENGDFGGVGTHRCDCDVVQKTKVDFGAKKCEIGVRFGLQKSDFWGCVVLDELRGEGWDFGVKNADFWGCVYRATIALVGEGVLV